MKEMLQFLAKKLRYLRGYFPAKLPVGAAEFNRFADQIFDTYDLPNLPSYRHAIASMIMHLSPTVFHKSAYFFAVSVKKAMANQVAFEVIQQIREEEKKPSEEVTPQVDASSSDPLPN